MKLRTITGQEVTFPSRSIETIVFQPARYVLSPEDCQGNNIAPNATVMYIKKTDGETACFEAERWQISDLADGSGEPEL